MSDTKNTISKIPPRHQHLISGYKFKSEHHPTLGNKGKHVGEIDEKNKKITIASPYNYSREFTVLHEVAHSVWVKLLDTKLKKEWEKLVKKYKSEHKDQTKKDAHDSLDQNYEEIFCMVYATFYAKHPPKTYAHDSWLNFIKNKVPN